MKIPTLPTDNLYKFAAIFGLVLIVFSSYMFNQTVDNAYRIEDDLNAKNALFKLDSLQSQSCDSLNIAKSKVQINKDYNQYRRIINKLPSLFYLYLFLFLLGFGLAGVGFYNWFYRTQKLNDEILTNEAEKVKNDKAISVHKIQFEKEFEVYKELWPELIKLRNATHQLRPMIEFREANKTEDEIRIKKGNEFNEYFNNCIIAFEENKPFYPEDIFNEIETILSISKKEAIQWQHMPKREHEYYKNAEKNMDEIIANIDNVCLKIRDRIGLLKINN